MSLNKEQDRFYFELAEQTRSNMEQNDEMDVREAAWYAVVNAYEFTHETVDRQIVEYTIDQVEAILS